MAETKKRIPSAKRNIGERFHSETDTYHFGEFRRPFPDAARTFRHPIHLSSPRKTLFFIYPSATRCPVRAVRASPDRL
jgi:hypothetical protein